MAEMLLQNDQDDEDAYPLEGLDALGVLSSARWVVEQGELVWINRDRLNLLREQLVRQGRDGMLPPIPAGYERYHFYDGTEYTVNWVLVLDAVNFCFWAEKNQPRWTIDYQGERLNGYWAEAAALTRAVEEGKPLWDAGYLSNMNRAELADIFRGEQSIPLFEQRLHNIREVGRVLLERFDGQFVRAVEAAGGSAVALTLLLANEFPSFHDVALYRNRQVFFFKRAQICVADLHGFFSGQKWGAFNDLDRLTIFADYKLPQVLRHFGVLEYHPLLAERVDNQEILEAGGEEEIELRAATVWACELLRRELAAHSHSISAAEIDQRLWLLSQDLSDMRPYHRVRTIYY